MKTRVLYITHNHLSSSPGGVEVYAHELYESMRASGEFEPLLLARTGAPYDDGPIHHDTPITAAGSDPNQYLFFTELGDYDALMLTNRRKDACIRYFRNFLAAYKPDLIHFHHTLFLGLEFITEARHALPHAPIVFTLHEYLPICHNHGQMVRTRSGEPCLEASPRRCHECFPEVSHQSFLLRERFIAAHLKQVDQFIAPSRFLLERFVQWGIPREKIVFEEHGRTLAAEAPAARPRPAANTFGFFGRLTPFKGVTVLLEATRLLMADGVRAPMGREHGFQVHVHGSGLESAEPEYQRRVNALLEETKAVVSYEGRYAAAQLPDLMSQVDWVVMPSIWWENAPLVIQEAFAHRRPVICSNIGGMAEKVQHLINGLHFRANDPVDLAGTMQKAMASADLWPRLHEGISPVRTMEDHVGRMGTMYKRLIEARSRP
jgi:glycosyltransferase involved in cell wall biosynthesis